MLMEQTGPSPPILPGFQGGWRNTAKDLVSRVDSLARLRSLSSDNPKLEPSHLDTLLAEAHRALGSRDEDKMHKLLFEFDVVSFRLCED